MSAFRSVVIALLLTIWAVELVAPLHNHRWFDAHPQPAYVVIAGADRATGPSYLVVSAQRHGQVPVGGEHGLQWALFGHWLDPFSALPLLDTVPHPFHADVYPPPLDIPPRRVGTRSFAYLHTFDYRSP